MPAGRKYNASEVIEERLSDDTFSALITASAPSCAERSWLDAFSHAGRLCAIYAERPTARTPRGSFHDC